MRKFIRRTGLPPSSVHSLRHTYASLLLAERTPLVVVAHNLGHAQASTTVKKIKTVLWPLPVYSAVLAIKQEAAQAGMTVSAYVKSEF